MRSDFHIYGRRGLDDLFMRWDNRIVLNSTQEFENLPLAEQVSRLEKRIAELETLVRDLNSFVFHTSEQRCGTFADFSSEPMKQAPPPKKRGRRPRIAPEELARRRDYLVEFIEIRWPDLVTVMKRRTALEQLLKTIKLACPGAESTEGYIKMTEHVGDLWEFLKSGRYKSEPRQIAYALAGVPEMTWRSSLDYCTKNPSQLHIRPEAFLDHVRRRNPKCHRDLLANGVTDQNRKLLSRCCIECHRLATIPECIQRVLQDGKPMIRP